MRRAEQTTKDCTIKRYKPAGVHYGEKKKVQRGEVFKRQRYCMLSVFINISCEF